MCWNIPSVVVAYMYNNVLLFKNTPGMAWKGEQNTHGSGRVHKTLLYLEVLLSNECATRKYYGYYHELLSFLTLFLTTGLARKTRCQAG